MRIFSCFHSVPSLQTYSALCRFELACAQCLPDGCDSDLSNVTIDTKTVPTCEAIPDGVWPNSTAITLAEFDIKKGYFRISAESPLVLECFRAEACKGGVDPRNYCANGYQGPCESIEIHLDACSRAVGHAEFRGSNATALPVKHVGILALGG